MPPREKGIQRLRLKKLGSQRLQHVIDLCKSIEDNKLDPFVVDVTDILDVVRKYFLQWDKPSELILDAEAIHHLASVIKRQGDWLKQRSTSLSPDPFLLVEKIGILDRVEIARLFLTVWHPIVELEQISDSILSKSLEYWQNLLPLSIRWARTTHADTTPDQISHEDLVKSGMIADRTFAEDLDFLYNDLTRATSKSKKIRYWDFIGADTFFETMKRAYLTSFLVNYGYATFEILRLEEEIFIIPIKEPTSTSFPSNQNTRVSLPISISYEEWRKWKGGREIEKETILRNKN